MSSIFILPVTNKTDFSELQMHHEIHPGDPGRTALEKPRTAILLLISKSL